MASKKTFLLRLDEASFAALEQWAANEFRSVNGQLEWIIHQALRQHGYLNQKDKHTKNPPEAPTTPPEGNSPSE